MAKATTCLIFFAIFTLVICFVASVSIFGLFIASRVGYYEENLVPCPNISDKVCAIIHPLVETPSVRWERSGSCGEIALTVLPVDDDIDV